ncbi:MAG: hypothetical protein RL346_1156 [Verrucomicrobiota bacterium]|jgi:hypothetical protein
MSIHVRLSAEAQAKLERDRRNSTVLSLISSCVALAVIFFLLGFWLLPRMEKTNPDIVIVSSPKPEIPAVDGPKPNHTIRSKPMPPANPMSRVIVSDALSHVSLPSVQTDMVGSMSGLSVDTDFGGQMSIGPGNGFKGEFKPITGVMSKRCSQQDRLNRLREMGGREEAEAAVEKGLEWLKSTQQSDGSWSNRHVAAMTGFGVLAYLGRCETPASEKYGDSCLRAIIYLVDLGMKQDGKLSNQLNDKHWPYEHAIATYALCEAVTFTNRLDAPIPNLEAVTKKALDLIIENQHEKTGGWDYAYDKTGGRGGDLSIAAWHIQALKAASHTGIPFVKLKTAQKKATEYVKSMQGDQGGFGYVRAHAGDSYAKLTGAGVLCLQMSGKGDDSSVRKGVKHILEFTKFDYNGRDSNLYAHYYESQAMMARGGTDWRTYNEIFRDPLIESQNPDGSWRAPGSGAAYGDIHYRSCLNILMLEVYYRFLPGTGAL